MQPTHEQTQAVDLFRSGVGLAIEAGAGTGKTSTLELIARSTGDHGTYVAFNRAIVEEAKRRMPGTVRAATAHSLAMRAVGSRYRHRLDGGRIRSDEVARRLKLDFMVVTYDGTRKVLQPGYLAGLVMRTIQRFCFSADETPGKWHVPFIPGIDPADSAGRRSTANNELVRDHILGAIGRAWADISDPAGDLRFSHDNYLKLWQLSGPKIPGSFLLFDEAQDAAPVMLAAVTAQEGKQIVYVGDSQQQIYEWRGAVNALSTVEVDAVAYLSESFRFGPPVAALANGILGMLDAELRLKGRGGPSDVITSGHLEHPDAVLTRSNAEAVSTVLRLQADGRRPHLIGGGEDVVRFARAAQELKDGQSTFHPELACFDSWGEVQAYVKDDPQGDELKLLVDLVDEYTVPTILQALEQMPDELQADVAVSTAHKAKGREWRKVRLAGDFQEPEDNPGEWRLLYVAATRAREVLDVTACDPLRDLATAPTLDMAAATVTDRLADAFPEEPEPAPIGRVFICGRGR